MKLGDPIKIGSNLYQIRAVGARVTVLIAGRDVLLIDAGARGSLRFIKGGLQALGLGFDQITLTTVTHHHPDHAGGLRDIVDVSHAPVAAHRADAPIIRGEEQPPPFQNSLLATLTKPVVGALSGSPTKVDHEVEDGDILPFREEVRVVHLPGHTVGSIALHIPEKGTVVVGDALEHRSQQKLGPPARRFSDDHDQAIRSLRKLLDIEIDTLCFSHFPPLRKGVNAALKTLLTEHGL